jgi:cell division protein FtsB
VSRPERAWEEADELEMDGQVARWVEAVPWEAPSEAPRPQEPKRTPPGVHHAPRSAPRPKRRVRLGRLALVLVGGYLAVMAVSGEITLLHVRSQASALAQEASVLAAQNRVLAQRVRLLHTVAYTDELARTDMGYVSPGETPVVPVSSAQGTQR